MVAQAARNPSYCGSQKAKAKSQKARLVARLVRQAGPSCQCLPPGRRRRDLDHAAKPKKFPRVLIHDFAKGVDAAVQPAP